MKLVSLDELKSIQLDLLQKTAEFCENNGIRYYLCGGTLLGAIRHKGYIPWDDDIDISMPRPDYDKFIGMFNNPENYYQVIDMSNNPKYGFPFAKVHDTRTFVDELQYAKDQFGVYIDIFPIDGVGEDEQVFRILRWRKILHTKKANYFQRTLSKKIINTFGKILLLPFSVHQILKMMDREARKYPYGSTARAGIIINPYGTREIVDISVFDNPIPKKFEDREYMVPAAYDTWLRSIYGDYMQLPPEDKRHSPHVAIAYWK
jgi:lipopolysaccharide cholinephosphotransferase